MVYKQVNKTEDDVQPDDIEMQEMGNGKAASVHPEEDKKIDTGLSFSDLFMFANAADMTLFYIGILGTGLAGATLPGEIQLPEFLEHPS